MIVQNASLAKGVPFLQHFDKKFAGNANVKVEAFARH